MHTFLFSSMPDLLPTESHWPTHSSNAFYPLLHWVRLPCGSLMSGPPTHEWSGVPSIGFYSLKPVSQCPTVKVQNGMNPPFSLKYSIMSRLGVGLVELWVRKKSTLLFFVRRKGCFFITFSNLACGLAF